MEDKLREYRFLKQSNSDQKAVLLGQLDGVRRELLDVLASSAPRIMFAKEIVREVLNFACAGDDTPRSGASPSQPSSRLPSSREKNGRNSASVNESSLFSLMSASPKPSLPSGQPSYGSLHDNDLWDGSHNAKNVAGPYGNADIAVPVPGATTTASRGGSRSMNTVSTAHHDSMKDRSRRYGSSCTSIVSHHHITDEDIYGPAPIKKNTTTSAATKGSSPGGTVVASLPTATTAGGASGSSSAINNDVNRPGGMLKIREMLSRAEKGLSAVQETKEQRRAPPRILGGENNGHDRSYGTEDWDGISPSGYNTPSTEYDGEITVDGSRPWAPSGAGDGGASGHPGFSPNAMSTKSYSVRDWTIKAEPNSASQFTPRSATGGATDGGDASSTHGGGGNGNPASGLPGLVGKLAGFAFVLGSIAAATMAATGTLPGSHSKDASTAARTSSLNRSSARSPSNRRRASQGQSGADVPPWKDAKSNATPSSASGAGARRKASSGRTSKSPSRTSGGRDAPKQGPVMHVHQPPSSGSFPTVTPPDVTAAMG